MKIAYWIVAGLLAVFYLYAGVKKTTQGKEQLAPMMGWVDTTPMWVVRLIGVLEVAGVIGLVLPPLTGIAPFLAIVAAIGFAVLQILAGGVHLARREVKESGLNVLLVVLAGIAAWLATVWV